MKVELDRRMVAFAAPSALATAIEAAAAEDITTVSDVIRTAIMKDLRERGLWPARTVAA
jgi:hypothetical protein